MAQYSGRNSTVIKVKRSEIQPGDVVLGPAPRDLPLMRRPRPRYLRRTSSLDQNDFPSSYRGRDSDRGTIARRRDRLDPQDQYYSEGSIPPRSRRPAPTRRRQNRQQSDRGGVRDSLRDGDASSSESSSDLGSTTDDEKNKNKAKWKKWSAIGLAGVATIHAVHGVHETVEKTRTRRKELAEGEIGEEEAHKRKNKGRLRNAANVGIAAVWVHSAYSEIKEYREAQKEHAELCEKTEERHQKRLDRAKAIARGEYQGHHVLDRNERRKYLRDADDSD
jgi:hypothetical protein